MDWKEAVNQSQIWAARGYDPDTNECVVSVCHYGEQVLWLTGWGGDWKKEWTPIPESEMAKLDRLTFYPTGPKPEDQISAEVLNALSEIGMDYDLQNELGGDYLEPIGETYD